MRNKLRITILLMLISLWAVGQVDSLHKSLLIKALENNQQIKKAKYEVENSNYKVKEVGSSFMPTVSGSIDVKKYLEQPVVIIPGEMLGMPEDIEGSMGKPHTLDAGVSFSQILYSAQFLQSLKTVKNAQELYELKKIQTEEDIIYQVSLSYYYLLLSYENLNVLKENLELLEHNRLITKKFVDNEMAINTDLSKIKLKITETNNQINLTQSAIFEQQEYLKLLVGTDDFVIPENLGINENRTEFAFNTNIDLIDRIDFKTLLQMQVVNDSKFKTEKAKNYPTVSLFGNYLYNAQRDEFSYFDSGEKWNNTSLVGLKINIPIFSGFKNNSTIQQAKINQHITNLDIEYAENAYNKEYQISLHKLNSNRKNSEALYENTLMAKEIYDKSLLQYEEGMLSLTDLLISDTDLSNTKLAYLKSKLEVYQAELEVYKSSGEIRKLIEN